MAKNFPNLGQKTDIQLQENQRFPNKRSLQRPTPRRIITKMTKNKDKERILKVKRKIIC